MKIRGSKVSLWSLEADKSGETTGCFHVIIDLITVSEVSRFGGGGEGKKMCFLN